jgi:hypothetical protein
MASTAKIIISREKVPDAELQSVQQIPSDEVCVVYLGGNGTVERRRNDGSISTAAQNANGNARYVRTEIIEPLFTDGAGPDIPIYSVGYDFDDMDTGGTVTLCGDNKKANVHGALRNSENGRDNILVIDNRNIRRVFKNSLMPYLSERGQKIDIHEIEYRSRFLKIIIDGDEKTEFNFKKELYNTLLDLKYSDLEIDAITANVDKLIRHEHTEHIDSLFQAILLPRISKNGKRLPLNDALRAVRKITFVVHCYGAFVAKKLQKKMKSEMQALGYSDKEISEVLNQMLVVAHAPSCRLDNQTNGFISFMSAFDNGALVPVNWLSKYIKERASDDSRNMVRNSVKYKEHTWFPNQQNFGEPIAFLTRRYGNMVIVPQAFDFVIDEGMMGVDDNEHNHTSYNWRGTSETKSGYLLNSFAKNVIVNGVRNSLAQSNGFVPLPDVSELLFPDNNDMNKQIFKDMQKNGFELVRAAFQSATETLREHSNTNKGHEAIQQAKKLPQI